MKKKKKTTNDMEQLALTQFREQRKKREREFIFFPASSY
jgi:hypothetical protein